MAYEYIVDPIANLNSGTILNDVLHGEILASPGLTDFEGIEIDGEGAGVRYIFLKTSAWSASHKSTLDAVVTAHTATPLPGGTDISYQTAAVLQDPGTNEIMLTAPNPVSTNYTITLPPSVGSTGQILKTVDTSGTLNWVDEESSGANQIVQYDFGAKLDAGNRYTRYLGKASDSDLSSSTTTQTKCSIAYGGTLVKVAYQSENTDSTTRMEIRKNGSSALSFYCTNAITSGTKEGSGVESFSVSVSEGDYIQLKQISGQKPGESAWVIYQEIS